MGNQEKIVKIKPQIIEKGWGCEEIIANEEGFCGKLLHFNKAGHQGSGHFHLEKLEFFRVGQGKFRVDCIDPSNADAYSLTLAVGEIIRIPRGSPHQIYCLETGYIIEISSPDKFLDSYRISKGDSQK